MFDGSTLLNPVVNPSVNVADFRIIGFIFSHAYLVSGMLPDRVAFPCLASISLGQVTIPDSVLIDTYVFSLCDYDTQVVQKALQLSEYPYHLQNNLLTLLSSHGCKTLPNPSNIRSLLLQSVRYIFLLQPAAALAMLHQGIPKEHDSFWNTVSVEKLLSLYNSTAVSAEKILHILEEPEFLNKAEEEVWLFLRKFIGNMSLLAR